MRLCIGEPNRDAEVQPPYANLVPCRRGAALQRPAPCFAHHWIAESRIDSSVV